MPPKKLFEIFGKQALFCQWLAYAHVHLATDKKTILRGWEEPGLLRAWSDEADKLFEEATHLNAKGELFGVVNAPSVKASVGCQPALVEPEDPQLEPPCWHDCHEEDLDYSDDDSEETPPFPEALDELCARRVAMGLRPLPARTSL